MEIKPNKKEFSRGEREEHGEDLGGYIKYYSFTLKACKYFIKSNRKETNSSQAWWCTSVIPALGRLKLENFQFGASLSYTEKPCLTSPPKKRRRKRKEKKLIRKYQNNVKSSVAFPYFLPVQTPQPGIDTLHPAPARHCHLTFG
jgi:hypothetical protein